MNGEAALAVTGAGMHVPWRMVWDAACGLAISAAVGVLAAPLLREREPRCPYCRVPLEDDVVQYWCPVCKIAWLSDEVER